ncbi:MAG: DUF4166 domain-containing protein [Phycisphaerae bacterium]|nr:DUF4166 domain-containing protein [Phycisphaerae bacterium]
MTSILARAMGAGFRRLHPRLQAQYSVTSESGIAWVGRGVMSRIWSKGLLVAPFLRLGAMRRVMFPETGTDVPFTIWNYAYKDAFGRETLTWIREFELSPVRRFDETLVFSERRKRAVVYAGTHQHLAVELHFEAGDNGSLRLQTGIQRLYEWRVGLRIPRLVSGHAHVVERFNEVDDRFEIDVGIASPIVGPLFGYSGWFRLEPFACRREDIPSDAMPVREERRD